MNPSPLPSPDAPPAPKFAHDPTPPDHRGRTWTGQGAADDLEFHRAAVEHFQKRYDAARDANPYTAPEEFQPLLKTRDAHQTAVDAIEKCRALESGAAPALPVGRAAPYAWLTKSKATGEWLNWGADKPSEWVTVKNAGLFDVIPLYLAPPVSSRFDRESLAKLIHDGLGWNGLTDWYEKNADHPDIRKCYKAADAILASLTGGEPPQ